METFIRETIWDWSFLCGKIITSTVFTVFKAIQILSLLVSVCDFYFPNFPILFYVFKFTDIKMVIICILN